MRTLSAGRVASRRSGFLFARGHARKFLFTALAAFLVAQTSLAGGVAGSARLIRERRGHTATAIGGGKVLVAGGQNLSGALADVEIFDAATGTFTVAARLLTPRAEHTATRLADGRVFLVGGRGTEVLTSTEFFDPARNVFSSGPSLNSPRFGHTATLLPDGRVVVIGGNAAGTAEIFDPRAGTFTALPCHLSEPRSFHAAVRLLDGSILIAGGLSVDGKTLRSAEVLHPDTLECEPIGNMFAARARFALRMLPDGKVQAIGGDTERTMELFNPLGYFSSLGHLAGTANSEAAALRNPGRVAIIGPNARPISERATAIVGGRELRPVQSLLDRIDYSVTDIPEAGVAIATGGVSAAGRYQQTAVLFDASAATVTTDQTDYAPGQTVTITGTGWLPGETVTLNIHRDTNDPPDTALSAVADANGNITNSDYVVQEYDLGVTFLLTASGQTSGYTAQTTFTDGNVKFDVAPVGTTATFVEHVFESSSTCGGAEKTNGGFPKTVTGSNGDTAGGISAGQSIRIDAALTSDQGGSFQAWSSTDSPASPFTTSGPSGSSICIPGFGSGTRNYRATYSNNSPPVINRANATVTVNEGATAANTGTWSDANAGDTVTLSASVGTVIKSGTNASGTWSWSFATTDGPDQSQTVTITANDGTTSTSTTFSLVVNNVAPTASFTGPASTNEGTPQTYTFSSQTDPSTVDTSSGFHYAYDCAGGSLAGATYAGSGTTASTSCSFPDGPATVTVRARIIDKDDGFTEYTVSVTVSNVAPTVNLTTAPATANEGDTKSYVYTVTDPGVDTFTLTGGFPTCGAGNTLSNSVTNAGGGSFDCKFNDGPATPSVQVQVTDSDGAPSNTASQSVTVANVAPTATFNAPASVNEGSAISLSLTSPLDPSSADTTAGFQYAFDCGDGAGYGAYSATSTASCPTTDSSSRTVKGKIKDKDNGETEYTATVTVNNVAPTASLANNGPVNEGAPATISFSSQFDPSSTDTAAGFHYAYDCGGGSLAGATYAGSGTSASTSCSFADNGTYLVRARIIDKDNGFTEYTTSVQVNNVAPTLTAPSNQTGAEGTDSSYNLGTFSDPGTADAPWTVNVNWGDTHSDSFTTGAQGAIAHNHTYSDSGTYTVTVTVTDKDTAASNTITFQVTVSNAPPTATLANNGPVNEGSLATITFSNQADSSADDVAAGFHYAYSCTNGDLSGATYASTAGSTASKTCTFDDGPSTHTVKARIIDKDDGFTEYTNDVVVNNVNPTASLGNSGPVNEGSPATISFSGQFDPSNADTTAGFHYAYACDNGDLSGATYALGSLSASTTCPFVDNGTYTVKARIIDKDDGFSEYTTVVTVNNVAPSVTPPAGQSSNEGENKLFSLGSFSDPGTADSPWFVSVNWGDGHSDSFSTNFSGAISHSHTYDDNGTYTVTYTVTDKDGGVSNPASTFQVTVANVAPTATFSAPASVDEGGAISLSLTAPFDPSSADTTAGFQYAFDCGDGSGYGAFSATSTASCPTTDSGSRTVRGMIKDKDNGQTEYSATVTVNNVAPTAVLSNNGPVNEGSPATISFSAQFDPSSADTAAGFHYAYDCSGGSLAGATYAGSGTSASTACSFADNGTYLVRARIIDKDNGFTEYTTSVQVNNVAPTLTSPGNQTGNEGVDKSYDLGSFSDPGTLDAPWRVDVNWGDGNSDSFTTGVQGATAHNHTYADSGTYTASVTVTDKDNAPSNTITFQVTVVNTPPTADIANNGPVNEGSAATITFSNQFDPSATDTAAGFHYAYSCSNGDLSAATYASTAGSTATTTCTFDDGPSTHTVKARIIDKDDGFTEYTTDVVVNNVNPTASLGNNGPVNEGSPATVSFSGQFDPSSADTTAGFHYAYACDNGDLSGSTYALAGVSPTFPCTFIDNGTYTVKARIIDKDDGFTEYTTSVTVNNVVPSVTAPAGQSSDEGENKLFSLGSFSDPGTADNPWTVNVNWGDGHSDSFAVGAPGAISHSHTYDDNGSYTVTYTVTDKDGGISTPASTFSVTVNNVAPTGSLSNNGPVDEGATVTVSFSGQSDPSNADTTAGFHYAFSCANGDLSGATYAGSGTVSSTTCTFPDNGSHTVKARIIDKDGDFTEYTTLVVVQNANPSVGTVAVSPEPSNEGSSASASAGFTDSGTGDTHTCSINWGDGSTTAGAVAETNGNGSCSGSHTYADNGSYTVTITVTDDDGGPGSNSASHTVQNVAPVAGTPTLSASAINENGSTNVSGSFTDPGVLDTHTVTINWGDGSANTVIDLPAATLTYGPVSHTYLDDNPTATPSDNYTIVVTVSDRDGGSDYKSATVGVANVASIITGTSGTSTPQPIGSTASVTANFTDVGSLDSHTCTFAWDDGSPNTTVTAAGTGNGSCTATHTYSTAGVNTVTVTVKDDDTGQASTIYQFVVIYDPNGGFVTGGGWINQPSDGFPALTGKANFGFVSKYQTGKNATNVPTGETEFQFQAGDINFHSSAYDAGSLVISGGKKATYRGDGTVNGQAGYRFLLIAYDGDAPGASGPDRFRIKITKNGTVIYDNRPGSSEDPDLSDTTALGGGSIVIHK